MKAQPMCKFAQLYACHELFLNWRINSKNNLQKMTKNLCNKTDKFIRHSTTTQWWKFPSNELISPFFSKIFGNKICQDRLKHLENWGLGHCIGDFLCCHQWTLSSLTRRHLGIHFDQIRYFWGIFSICDYCHALHITPIQNTEHHRGPGCSMS
jgi:hypothetical protein